MRWAAAASWALACGAAAPEEVRVVLRTRAEVRSDHDEPWLAPWGMRRAEWSVRLLERIGDPAGAEIRRRLVEAATAQPRSGAGPSTWPSRSTWRSATTSGRGGCRSSG
ncbi:hypothetical protein ACFQY4_28665 [Catellatospora bangladeshensis]|uniref:hypothetical protein n=1 Tax=Catellatospora bangladeshensis TaxID=310355 RepID=UPI00362337D6